MKLKKIFQILLILIILVCFLHKVNAEFKCEVCSDVITEFNSSNTPLLGNLELGANNKLKLVGFQSHGLKSISINCELLCGQVNQPCCYNTTTSKWYCSSKELYCDQQNENGICRLDNTPPMVGVASIPANVIATQGGCESYLNEPATAYVTCEDIHTGCEIGSERIYIYYPNFQNVPGSCPNNYNIYYGGLSSQIVTHAYVCGAAKDLGGNANFTSKPVEFCVNTQNPIPPQLWYTNVGGNFVDLVWYQPVSIVGFDRYELHYSTQPNFQITPATLYKKYTQQSTENKAKVENLKPNTQYYFKVIVFDKSYPISKNATSNELGVKTVECNPNQKIQCIRDWTGKTWYGDDVSKVIKGVCRAGNATCINGYWGWCENQTGPFTEVCNGLDDDCDGYVDNEWKGLSDLLSKPCKAYGVCGWGFVYCINGKWQNSITECSSLAYAEIETCNGLDDDCDGVIDDELNNCGCYKGVPKLEICNGIDDDCNGVIDDVSSPSTCACYKGAHKPGELQEICNGVDDDCNGLVDDPWRDKLGPNWPFGFAPCGQGTLCQGGHWECNKTKDGVVCSTIGGSENLAMKEECNGLDDDCDGSIDEECECSPPGNITKCGLNIGICREGYQICENGKWSECRNSIDPRPETCNGIDDDCNGVIDDVGGKNSIKETRCGCFNGTSPKKEICNGIDDDCNGVIDDVSGGNSINSTKCACYNGTSSPGKVNELCNGIDDDCNGVIDDPWNGILGNECGTGACVGGKIICNSTGDGTTCSTNFKRQPEVCNGIDDDCNGVIDDIDGKQTVEETQCGCFGDGEKKGEKCNHIDDDCDDEIDEDLFCICYEGETKPCGSSVGECELGLSKCIDGIWGICEGAKGPTQEKCNMKDDNCDGIVDNVKNGYSVEETQCGCFGGRLPKVEVCNGIDDDCNGLIDDDVDCRCEEGQEMPCGSNVGECIPGVKRCVNGKWSECQGGSLPTPEVCNGKDDDCNGIVDDVSEGNSISSTKCACYNNYAKPGTQSEILNGIDDDCDGMIDEGFIGWEEPTHCFNDKKDGDEEGVDCGGSCKKKCVKTQIHPLNTWMIIFALILALIIIFGIFLSTFYKKETKSIYERVKKVKRVYMQKNQIPGTKKIKKILEINSLMVFYFLLSLFIVVILFTLLIYSQTSVRATSLPKFTYTWSCANGGFSYGCFQQSCMGESQLKMDNNQYEISFSAPINGNYSCSITAVTNYFNCYDSGTSCNEYNEKTQIYINGKLVGFTQDPYCPQGGSTIGGDGKNGGVCTNNIPNEVGMITDGCKFLEYGDSKMDHNKFCEIGYIKFRFDQPPSSDELNVLQKNEDEVRVLLALGNTRNRNLVMARLQYYGNTHIIKIGGGACWDCWSCCYCQENLPVKDSWCGSEVFRSEAPQYNGNSEYKLRWDSSTGAVCIEKDNEGEKCFNRNLPTQLGLAFNSYCTANKCDTVRSKPVSNSVVKITEFNCQKYITTPPCSCFVNTLCVGRSTTSYRACEGGGEGPSGETKVCGETCTPNVDICEQGVCKNVNGINKCFECCGDGVCQNNEDSVTCSQDCGGGGGGECGDGICNNEEDYDTCPSDCPPPPPL